MDVIVSTAFTSNKNDFKLGAAARKMTFFRSIFASCTGAGDSSSIVCCISGSDVSDDGKSVVASGVCSGVVLQDEDSPYYGQIDVEIISE